MIKDYLIVCDNGENNQVGFVAKGYSYEDAEENFKQSFYWNKIKDNYEIVNVYSLFNIDNLVTCVTPNEFDLKEN